MHKVLQPKWQPGDRATTKESHTIVLWWYFPIIWSELRFWNLTVCHFTKNTFLPSEANSPSVPSLYCWLGEDQVIVFLLPTPTVDTQTFWICGKGSCEKCTPSHQLTCGGRKNLQNWNFSAPRNAVIGDWSLIFILFSRDQYHTWKHRRISIALILYDKFLRVN